MRKEIRKGKYALVKGPPPPESLPCFAIGR